MHEPSHNTGTPVPAITRRAALLGAVVSTAALAVPAAAALGDPATAEIDALIEKHRAALALDGELWDRLSEIDDTIEGKRPLCRVQTGKLLNFGKNDDGTDKWTPIYSYSVEQIEKLRDEDIDSLVRFHCWGKHAAAREQSIREKRTAWADGKIAQLRALEAEAKRIEDEAGYTEAAEAARNASEATRAIEQAILDLVPDTLSVAAKKARWIAQAYRDHSYLSDQEDALLIALDTIAAAVSHG